MSDPIGIAGDRIRSFVERIEQLDTELQEINEQKKEVLAEAKGEGFDVKVLKEIIRLRKQDKDERDEHETLLDVYMRAMDTTAPAPMAEAAWPFLSHHNLPDWSSHPGGPVCSMTQPMTPIGWSGGLGSSRRSPLGFTDTDHRSGPARAVRSGARPRIGSGASWSQEEPCPPPIRGSARPPAPPRAAPRP